MLGPGSRIGGLVIDSVIGRGAMGEVYRATQTTLKRKVAVKRIAEHLLAHPEAIARFEREAQCLARVHSAHVIGVHDFGKMKAEDGSEHYLLVMELVEGGRSLRHVIGRALDWRQATSLAQQVAEGLAAAAEFGVVHRDVKPDNIMLNDKGIAKLADFGLARSGDSTDMTVAGSVLGTPAYMSPEACRGEEVDARSDLYALGATWYHLLAGRTPFQASNTPAMLLCHIDDEVPPIASLAPGLPPEIAQLVHRCLEKDPTRRPRSAQALVDEMRALALTGIAIPAVVPEVVAALDTPTDPATAETNMVTPRTAGNSGAGSSAPTVVATAPTVVVARSRRPLLVGLTLLVAVGAAIAAWSLRPSPLARSTHDIEAALASGDTELAIRRADEAVAAMPERPEPRALARKAITAEIARILTASRFSDARRRLAELRQTRTWLDDAELARDVDLKEARFHAQQHDYEESARILLDLRKRYPQDLLVCRSLVEDLCESNRQDGVLGAAVQFADATPGELPAEILETLKRGFRNTGRYSDVAKRLRALLIAHDPTFVNAMRSELDSDEHGDRVNAYSVLTDVKQLTPDQELRYHVKNLVMLSSSYSEAGEALDYLGDAGDKPGWTERKRAAGLKPITEVKALESDDEHASKVMSILTGPLLTESREQLAQWATSDDDFADKNGCLRANAYRALSKTGLAIPTLIEPWAFHERSLRTFHMGQEPFWFTEAVDFFRAQTAKRPAEAKAVLQACAARLEENIAGYKRAQMDLRFTVAPMRELGIVRAAMDGKPPP